MKKKYFTEEERKIGRRESQLKNQEKHRRARGILPRRKFTSEEERQLAQKERAKKRYQNNKIKILKQQKIYKEKHKKEIKINQKEYQKNKLQTDVNFKLAVSLRGRLYHAIKDNQKLGSAVRDLGCSIPELKLYLESKFREGMTWENWSKRGWHIDHIIPLCNFDLKNRTEFLKACHYSNLQPMWAEENLKKKR